MRREARRGFTLVELLVTIGIIGVLAAIAIFNYLAGLQRARQKKTMADMRTIAQAWEAKGAEGHGYNAAGFTFPTVAVTATDLNQMLVPTYAKSLPDVDGWRRPFAYGLDQPLGGPTASLYAIRSAGADGQYTATYSPGPFDKFECDIVYANGAFVAYPDK